jgi:hypothetical protein
MKGAKEEVREMFHIRLAIVNHLTGLRWSDQRICPKLYVISQSF